MTAKAAVTVLTYPCNIVGYVRLALLGGALAWCVFMAGRVENLWVQIPVVLCIVASLSLDILDGYLARKFNHVSKFGILFDLLIDLVTHTFSWTISGLSFAPVFIIIEWAGAFFIAVFGLQPDSGWKNRLVMSGKGLLRHYFRNNQRNVLSLYSNFCHFIFPIALFLNVSYVGIYAITFPGVILYEIVTLYLIIVLAQILIQQRTSH